MRNCAAERRAAGPHGTSAGSDRFQAATVLPTWPHPASGSPWVADDAHEYTVYFTTILSFFYCVLYQTVKFNNICVVS